jgi:hypothetical protein
MTNRKGEPPPRTCAVGVKPSFNPPPSASIIAGSLRNPSNFFGTLLDPRKDTRFFDDQEREEVEGHRLIAFLANNV